MLLYTIKKYRPIKSKKNKNKNTSCCEGLVILEYSPSIQCSTVFDCVPFYYRTRNLPWLRITKIALTKLQCLTNYQLLLVILLRFVKYARIVLAHLRDRLRAQVTLLSVCPVRAIATSYWSLLLPLQPQRINFSSCQQIFESSLVSCLRLVETYQLTY